MQAKRINCNVIIILTSILLQIEVLGVSLPWRGILNNEGPGAALIDPTKSVKEDTNPFLSSSDTNPYNGASFRENVSTSVQSSSSGNSWVDLLTGGESFSDHVAQPVTENIVGQGSDLLDFLDQSVVDYHGGNESDKNLSSSQEISSLDSRSQRYINCLYSLVGPHMVCAI